MQVILIGRENKHEKTHKEGFNILKQSQLFLQKVDYLFCIFTARNKYRPRVLIQA